MVLNVSFDQSSTENFSIRTITDNVTLPPDDSYPFLYYPSEMSVLYLCISFLVMVIILIGNGLVVISFYLERSLRQASNYQIVGLAITDILMGLNSVTITSLYTVTRTWFFGVTFCHVWSQINWTTYAMSQHGCMLICLDRFLSIKFYIKYRAWRTKTTMLFSIFACWIFAHSFHAVIFAFFVRIETEPGPGAPKFRPRCDVILEKGPLLLIGVVYFWIPVITMCLLYWYVYSVAADLARNAAARKKNQFAKRQSTPVLENNMSRCSIEEGDQSSNAFSDTNQSSLRNHEQGVSCCSLVDEGNEWKLTSGNNFGSCNGTFAGQGSSVESSRGCGVCREKRKYRKNVQALMPLEEIAYTDIDNKKDKAHRFIAGRLHRGTDIVDEDCKSVGNDPCNYDLSTSSSHCYEGDVSSQNTLENREAFVRAHYGRYDVNNSSTVISKRSDNSSVAKKTQISDSVGGGSGKAASSTSGVQDSQKRPVHVATFSLEESPTMSRDVMYEDETDQVRTRKVLRVVSFILAIFLLSYSPFWMMFILGSLMNVTPPWWAFQLGASIGYFNSALNPYAYAASIPMFMTTFKRLLRCKCHKTDSSRSRADILKIDTF